PLTALAFHLDGTLVLFDNSLHDCEAETGTFPELLGREEGVEDLGDDILRDTMTGISHGEPDHPLVRRNPNPKGSTVRHLMKRVHDEIDHHLTHLICVCKHGRT